MTASDRSAAAVEVAQRNARRLGLVVEITCAPDLPPGEYDLVVANLPYVREDEWDGLAPEIREYEPREALVAGADGLDEIRALVAEAPAGTLLALEHAPDQAEAVSEMLADAETRRGPLEARARDGRPRAVTFDECIRAGGVVLFPADTVYGLAVDPGNEEAIERMYGLKGRAAREAVGAHVLLGRRRAGPAGAGARGCSPGRSR